MPHFRCVLVYRACALAVVLTLAACGSSGDTSGGQQQARKTPPVPVDIKTVQPHAVDIYSEYPGRVEGKRTVQVRARVEGILEERHYTEGQIVEKGDLLFSIDQEPFLAVEAQRKAELANARAGLNKAQRTWKRVRHLYKVDAVSEAERDQALSAIESARAQVQLAEANLDSAEINLGYTRANAPLTGVTSLRETDEGSLVQSGTRLTTITQLDPVYVLFALPEDDAIARRKALSQMGSESTDEATRQATIILAGDEEYPARGEVDFTQSTINPDTGTVQLRAVVDNVDNILMPGRYVRARIRLETRDNAIVVPNGAISSSQQQTQVFTVDNGKASPVTVTLGPNVEGGRIITDGLSAGDRVIVSGMGQVKPGAPVKIKSGDASGAGGESADEQSSATGQSGKSSDLAVAEFVRDMRLVGLPARPRLAFNNAGNR